MNNTSQYIKFKGKVLSVYFTAAYPNAGDSTKTILSLQQAGVDMIEVGLPFSDPLADGPVIQESSQIALKNGFTIDKLLDDLDSIADKISVPLVPMGYYNAFLQYGFARFLSRLQHLKIDTVIIPDLPPEIYEIQYKELFQEFGVSPVFLITPQTSTDRISALSQMTEAFIYAVADNSITGKTGTFSTSQLNYFEKIKSFPFRQPVMIGFGISDKNSFETACSFAHGAIIGSAFIRAVNGNVPLETGITNFVRNILG